MKKNTILIVDDNKYAADALARLLAYEGHTVKVAYEGETAIGIVKEMAPEVIILDIALPGKDGYEVARLVREDLFSNALLIALSGYGQKEDKLKAKESGFDHHLTKPVLVADIEKLMAAHGKK